MGTLADVARRAFWGGLLAVSLASVGEAGTCWYGPTVGRTVPLVGQCVDACFSRSTGSQPWAHVLAATLRSSCTGDDGDTDEYSWRVPTSYDPSGIGADIERTGIVDPTLTTPGSSTLLADIKTAADRVKTKLATYGTRLGAGDLSDVFDVYQLDIGDDVSDLINQIKGFGCLSGIAGLFGEPVSPEERDPSEGDGTVTHEIEPPEGWVERPNKPGVWCEPRPNAPDKPMRNGDCVDLNGVKRVNEDPEGQRIFGGFSVAALVPILLDILGTDGDILGGVTKQLCHQRSIEAATKGQARLQGETLKALYAPTTQRPIFTPGSAGGMQAQFEAWLVENGAVQRGDAAGLLQQIVAMDVSRARAGLAQQARLFGDEELDEAGGPTSVVYGAWTAFGCQDRYPPGTAGNENDGCEGRPFTTCSYRARDSFDGMTCALAEEWASSGEVPGVVLSHCSARNSDYGAVEGRSAFDEVGAVVSRTTTVSDGAPRDWVREFTCRGRNRTSGGARPKISADEDFYAFDEEADPATVKAYWESLVSDIDFGEDSILSAEDVEAAPRGMMQDGGYMPGSCSVGTATTELDCYVAKGTWTAAVGDRPALTGPATCIAEVEAPER